MGWDVNAWLIVAVLVVTVLALAGYAYRLRRLFNARGSIQVAVRVKGSRHWRNGVAIFTHESLDFYATRSLRISATQRFDRQNIIISAYPPNNGVQVLRVRTEHKLIDIASTTDAIGAIQSWIDSAAPEAEPTEL